MRKIIIQLDSKLGQYSALRIIKLIKSVTELGLKDSKDIYNDIRDSKEREIEILDDVNFDKISQEFKEYNIKIQLFRFHNRERKLKKILYSNQETLILEMLSRMGNWENELSDDEKYNNSYSDCKEIAIDNIFNEFKEYININIFETICKKITINNKINFDSINSEFIILLQHYCNLNTLIKLKKDTGKDNKDELIQEMSKTLEQLLSIYSTLCQEINISFIDILTKINE